MMRSNIVVVLTLLLALISPAYSGIAWGTFLGADWADAEATMRQHISVYIHNLQKFCSSDVQSVCPNGKAVIDNKKSEVTENTAVTAWTSSSFQRHTYKRFSQVPLGFGDSADNCLRSEFSHYQSVGIHTNRLTPKCFNWMEKTQDRFNLYHDRVKSDDKREGFVIFATLFAMAMSAAVGYMIGLYQKEHEDMLSFSHDRRHESKKIFAIIALAISIPACIILFTCPRFLVFMTIALMMGRAVQWYIQKKEDISYSALSPSDSGLVFAAIPVQMD
mmetsp:Transcript_11652/g.17834  ORF Transcript_11652/g.17834 Transcript_11652/m.17834 type:complete len:275 (-) Transcript_11652:54-878(-)|eukprot:CAMPEP_0201713764 /NCGR_PEP_ID=MMETSP0593-20130828/487_1 /ASSEMBLY_ACC=CAM_ASM_000672 /TAXON_ID=267983 /ORGANISM="Skeletonema japonicum, Strain CCMP2506" /LENGTH=274 /DNA_ID=CAMNT_0048202945 /DNA_START=73 /DNA_END=897 /DNA_ORIENTATION=-